MTLTTSRRGAIAAACLVIAAAALPVTGVAKERAPKRYTIEQFVKSEYVAGASFSADESRVLYTSDRSGVPNVVSVAATGGEPVAITRSTETTSSVAYFPTDDRVLFTRDQGGNELNHLYVRELDGSERDLTPGDKLKATFGGFTIDGRWFYVLTNERDARAFDIYRYDSRTYERTLLFQNDKGAQIAAASDDLRYVALSRPRTTSDNELTLLDRESGKTTVLSSAPGNWSAQQFTPDGRYLYYLTNAGGEHMRVRRYDVASDRHEDVESHPWDVMYTTLSERGTYRVTAINQDARTVLSVVETATGKAVALPALPNGDITSVTFSRSEKRVALYLSSDRTPRDLYVFNVGGKTARRLTSTLNPEIDPADLVDTSIVRFKARDGLEIPNVLYKPHGASANNKAPAIVFVHGGPGGQTRQGYSSLLQYLANSGYVVLGINNRGSSGYGRTFYMADDQKHGREPLWDCVDAKAWLQQQAYVDPDRIAIAGGSYGGYMVAAALAFEPDVFDAGVNIFGVTNWVRTLESIPPYWEAQRQALYLEMGNPETQREMLIAISPLFHADRIRKPMLVLQGANDPRVLQVESDEIVAAVKRNGVPVEYIVFPDEGHGFSKSANQVKGYGAIVTFLDEHLKPRKPAAQ